MLPPTVSVGKSPKQACLINRSRREVENCKARFVCFDALSYQLKKKISGAAKSV
jgi:hypothetical protein